MVGTFISKGPFSTTSLCWPAAKTDLLLRVYDETTISKSRKDTIASLGYRSGIYNPLEETERKGHLLLPDGYTMASMTGFFFPSFSLFSFLIIIFTLWAFATESPECSLTNKSQSQ